MKDCALNHGRYPKVLSDAYLNRGAKGRQVLFSLIVCRVQGLDRVLVGGLGLRVSGVCTRCGPGLFKSSRPVQVSLC